MYSYVASNLSLMCATCRSLGYAYLAIADDNVAPGAMFSFL